MPLLWLTKDVWRMKGAFWVCLRQQISLKGGPLCRACVVDPKMIITSWRSYIWDFRYFLWRHCLQILRLSHWDGPCSLQSVLCHSAKSGGVCKALANQLSHHPDPYQTSLITVCIASLEVVDPLEVLSHPCRFHAAQEGFELVEHADGTQDAWGAARYHLQC